MGTAYSDITDVFLHRVEEDRDFFNLINLLPEEVEDVIKIRTRAFLREAIAILSIRHVCPVNFSDRSDDTEKFGFDLSEVEIYLLASLMYQVYLSRYVAKIKALNVNYTATDLRVFDPSNARSTYLELYQQVCDENELLMDAYISQNRDGGYITTAAESFDDD